MHESWLQQRIKNKQSNCFSVKRVLPTAEEACGCQANYISSVGLFSDPQLLIRRLLVLPEVLSNAPKKQVQAVVSWVVMAFVNTAGHLRPVDQVPGSADLIKST